MRIVIAASLLLFAGFAQAKNCVIDVKGDDQMKFDKASVTVSAACKTIEIKLMHTGKLPITAMGHNLVISPTADFQAVGQAGMTAGAAANYVPTGDKRVIAHTKVVGGGGSTTASFPGSALKAGGDYTFYCSFPGHWAIMKGKLIVE